jgi:hypothetical protein
MACDLASSQAGGRPVKIAHPFALLVLVVVASATAAILLHDRASDDSPANVERAEYDALVANLGGDEPAIRSEFNDLLCTASATLDSTDRVKVNALKRECLDARELLAIRHLQQFIADRDEGMAFHFVGAEHRNRLRLLAGDHLSPERVIAIRESLAYVAQGFAAICQPPDWSLEVEGDSPPPLPILDLLRDAHRAFPTSELQSLRANPRVPAFSGGDGELLVELDQFFNGPNAKAAFSASRFPNLYVNGRIPAIPTAIAEYKKEIADAVLAERRILLPGDPPDPDGVQALNEVYGRLELLLSAIAAFAELEPQSRR